MDMTLDDNTFQLAFIDLAFALFDVFFNIIANVLLPGILTHFIDGIITGLTPPA